MQAYMGSSSVPTDDASCFNASQLSININAAEFPWYTLQLVAAVLLIVDLDGDKSSLKACPEDAHHRVFE